MLEDTGKGDGVREPSPENGEGCWPPTSRCCASALLPRPPTIRPSRQLLAKKDELEQQIDELKYEKAAMPPDEYKKQLSELLLELAKTQEELDK